MSVVRRRPDGKFAKGNASKPKGCRDRRTVVGIEVARAMAERASGVLEALLSDRSARVRLEAARTILAYAWGAPRQTVELAGGVGDLAAEIAAALAEVRARRLEVAPIAAAVLPAKAGA